MTRPGAAAAVVAAVVAAALALVVPLLVTLLAAGGHDAGAAAGALWRGSFGTSYAFVSATLVRATPLVLAGLAVGVAFRAGVLNIGAEGQLLAGGAAAAAVGLRTAALPGWLPLVLALTAGMACGVAWAGVAAALRRRFGVLEVISTLLLNFVAAFAVGWLVRGPLQEPLHIYPQSASLAEGARLPLLVPGSRLHVGFAAALALAALLWWMLRSTAAGFRLRVVGLNPSAAASAGLVAAEPVATGAFLLSGALAGLAGAVEVTGVTFALYEGLAPGAGYTAIAVALLARLHPLGIVLTGVLFGGLEAGAAAMQRDAGVPAVVASVVEAAVILAVLVAGRRRETPS